MPASRSLALVIDMKPIPITDIDEYRSALTACIEAEASSSDPALVRSLRPRIDVSPFSRCQRCALTVQKPNDPVCKLCGGEGFVRRVKPKPRASGGVCGNYASRLELVSEVWRMKDFGESRNSIAQAVGVARSTVDRIVDTGEGRQASGDSVSLVGHDQVATRAETIGQWIKRTREACDMSQQYLANEVRVKSSIISKYESGEITPRALVLKRLRAVLVAPRSSAGSPGAAKDLDDLIREWMFKHGLDRATAMKLLARKAGEMQ
jgi:ribosome-binding protein aMBF1 (putative translation factor)